MDYSSLDNALASTMVGESIKSLKEVYDDLESVQKSFLKNYAISCLDGCGECCKKYIPYLTESEALVAAREILAEGREEEILSRLSSSDPDSLCCPLYNTEDSYHCSLYKGRSLVCRLFGASVAEDKNHLPVYKDCKWKKEKTILSQKELEEKEIQLPVMSLYGERMMDCQEYGSDGESLVTAIPKALAKLQMVIAFSSSSSDDTI